MSNEMTMSIVYDDFLLECYRKEDGHYRVCTVLEVCN